jgi:hypothetical protein
MKSLTDALLCITIMAAIFLVPVTILTVLQMLEVIKEKRKKE